jgi:hypothetical protein
MELIDASNVKKLSPLYRCRVFSIFSKVPGIRAIGYTCGDSWSRAAVGGGEAIAEFHWRT